MLLENLRDYGGSRMARCAVCGKEVLMPFRCVYCGEYFCAEHRLPEKHNCPGLRAAASPYEKELKLRKEIEKRSEAPMAPKPRRAGLTAHQEITHLAVGALLVILVGFSLIGYNFRLHPITLAVYAIGFAASFLLHELGHRTYARSHGLYARFRLDPFGALLTLITAIPFIPFKIIAPGAVIVSGITSIEILGMTALIGPIINLALSAAFVISGFIIRPLSPILFPLGALNAFIALFNLIPFGELDGRKVLAWSPARWITALALSVILLIATSTAFRWI
ncbi:MAG: hypothetical protein DRN61_04920 [Thaumarchaeota archaeon]|nr:MAG: hypothetical protein DRN61_04920 [Nitrososphaerota archaeon]